MKCVSLSVVDEHTIKQKPAYRHTHTYTFALNHSVVGNMKLSHAADANDSPMTFQCLKREKIPFDQFDSVGQLFTETYKSMQKQIQTLLSPVELCLEGEENPG